MIRVQMIVCGGVWRVSLVPSLTSDINISTRRAWGPLFLNKTGVI